MTNRQQALSRYRKYSDTYRKKVVICAWCGKPIEGREEWHHWLVKRSALSKVHFELIDVPYNLMPLHPACHAKYGQTKEMLERCKNTALQFFTENQLVEWYNSLPFNTSIQSIGDI